MLSLNKTKEETIDLLKKLPVKLEPKLAEEIIDRISYKVPSTITKTKIALVLNSFLNKMREFSLFSDNFGIEGIFLNMKFVKKSKLTLTILPSDTIENNVECYVDEVI